MPLVPTTMQGLMMANAASQTLAGSKLTDLAAAISAAVCQYVLSVSTVNSTNIAMGPGSGTQTGTITGLVPATMSSLMLAKAASLGIAGRDTSKLFDAVSFGVVNSMSTVLLQGTIIGAGPGTGTGTILGLTPVALQGFILAQTSVKLLSGSKLNDIMAAVAFGVCMHLSSAVVQATDIGIAASPPAGPVPFPVAPGIGRLV